MPNLKINRKSGFVHRAGVMRRETRWVQILETVTTLSAASVAALFTGFGTVELGLRPFTIVRTRMFFHAKSDQSAATETWQGGIGMAVVSDQALAIGVTAVPVPFTDNASDLFFLYQTLAGVFTFKDASGIAELGAWKDVDSRAMRKVEDGQDLAITIQASSISNGVNIIKAGRMLIKLH